MIPAQEKPAFIFAFRQPFRGPDGVKLVEKMTSERTCHYKNKSRKKSARRNIP